jgi:hypothetical protein
VRSLGPPGTHLRRAVDPGDRPSEPDGEGQTRMRAANLNSLAPTLIMLSERDYPAHVTQLNDLVGHVIRWPTWRVTM